MFGRISISGEHWLGGWSSIFPNHPFCQVHVCSSIRPFLHIILAQNLYSAAWNRVNTVPQPAATTLAFASVRFLLYGWHWSKWSLFLSMQILLRWRGSVYKLIYKELLAYIVMYLIINLTYRQDSFATELFGFTKTIQSRDQPSRNLPFLMCTAVYGTFRLYSVSGPLQTCLSPDKAHCTVESWLCPLV